ncbi:pyridoxal phosphate-dependent transferase [Pseudomassariella vexata]|uniref:Pyridoxal phosphate-dependent transferase n=1 Tax=Pseudomassariella vexata TaxID=1141098 RepID=A0A1Y2D8V6_9PEZI|nr:pyridoxal phosphate-dependent transferase [Pseudomassariella vexata]ORY55691.1 pyridoxal phosphate-dependent transferase [Pseudomassariella vexata]
MKFDTQDLAEIGGAKLPRVKGSKERKYNVLIHDEGTTSVLDACGGAAVACLGTGGTPEIERVKRAVRVQMENSFYIAHAFAGSDPCDQLCEKLLASANDKNKGSEAGDSMMKLVWQYWHSRGRESERNIFLSRESSYHGNTIGALSISHFPARQDQYKRLLLQNCIKTRRYYPYRDQRHNETELEYVNRMVDELIKILDSDECSTKPKRERGSETGGDRVAAFILEPVSGAALGCQPAGATYLKKVKKVCHDRGILLVYDEVMCGLGRTGYMHAWHYDEEQTLPPNEPSIGKCLAAGVMPAAGIMVNKRVSSALGKNAYIHGHTYQAHLLVCAAALEVQKIVGGMEKDENGETFLDRIRSRGVYLKNKLDELLGEPYVGDVRGRSLFWGIEFVKDKASKTRFNRDISSEISRHGAKNIWTHPGKPKSAIHVYPGSWRLADKHGVEQGGHHIIIAPALNCTEDDIDEIVGKVKQLIRDFKYMRDPTNPQT